MYTHHACYITTRLKSKTKKRGDLLETKRVLFSSVAKRFDLTDRQCEYILERINQFHMDDEWIVLLHNEFGKKEMWIYLEGVAWIEEVYLNFDEPYYDAEIEFVKKQTKRLVQELKIDDLQITEITYHDMTVRDAAIYFDRKENTLHKQIKMFREQKPMWFEKKDNQLWIKKEGIQYFEENIYKKKYIKNLYQIKRMLQCFKKMGDVV